MEKQLFNIRNETSELIDSVSTGNSYKQKFSFGKNMSKIKGFMNNEKIVYSLPFGVFIIILMITRPSVILNKNKNGEMKTNYSKLLALTLILTILTDIGIRLLYFKN